MMNTDDRNKMQFDTKLFKDGKPCLYINVTSRSLPDHLRFWPEVDCSAGRITINDTPHIIYMRLIARFIIERLDRLKLQYTLDGDCLSLNDIDIFLSDPVLHKKEIYMVTHSTPIQIVINGIRDITLMLEMEIIHFLTRELLEKHYYDVEKYHTHFYAIGPIGL